MCLSLSHNDKNHSPCPDNNNVLLLADEGLRRLGADLRHLPEAALPLEDHTA